MVHNSGDHHKNERDFERVAQRREKHMRNIIGDCEIEEVLVGKEVLKEEITKKG